MIYNSRVAGVAQSVEQLIRNEKVGGSIPLSGTNKFNKIKELGSSFLLVDHLSGNFPHRRSPSSC